MTLRDINMLFHASVPIGTCVKVVRNVSKKMVIVPLETIKWGYQNLMSPVLFDSDLDIINKE